MVDFNERVAKLEAKTDEMLDKLDGLVDSIVPLLKSTKTGVSILCSVKKFLLRHKKTISALAAGASVAGNILQFFIV